MRIFSFIVALLFLSGCAGLPPDIKPVKPFELSRYLGKWYEIARLDHSFERGLNQVTAEYSLRGDGGVKVINRGYSIAKGEWKSAEGKAYFARDQDEGYLKVSFFGPFYGAYVVFELDQQDYQYAFVTSYDRSYLWFLSRTPAVSEKRMNYFREVARAQGFDVDKLIFVRQE